MNNNFAGKVAFITGASSGIGRATALAFAHAGAKVAVVDIDTQRGLETTQLITGQGGTAVFSTCDVSQPDDIKAAIKATLEAFGRLDYAFNNAGVESHQAFTADCTLENWERTIDINLKGVWLGMKEQIPLMLKQGGGCIVNCSSVAGLVGFPGLPAYVASKHGIVGLTKSAALEYASSNIRVNAVCPGVIQTPMIDRLVSGATVTRDELVQREPVGRAGRPEEVANAVLWLCSDQSSFVTGHALTVDGGWTAQ